MCFIVLLTEVMYPEKFSVTKFGECCGCNASLSPSETEVIDFLKLRDDPLL